MTTPRPIPAAAVSLTLLLLSGALYPACAAPQSPRFVPLPQPPGPKIRRVSHDAVKPVLPGDVVTIAVETDPGLKVTAFIGSFVKDAPCEAGGKGYRCRVPLPADAPAGAHKVRAQAADAKGRTSSLSAPLSITIDAFDPWSIPNKVNVRLVPAFFAAGSADLDAESKAALAKDAEALKANAAYPISIEGHADAKETGDLAGLSRRRAEAVRDHLASLGVARDRMKVDPRAEKEPATSATDDAGRAVNRRVMVLLQPLPSTTSPR